MIEVRTHRHSNPTLALKTHNQLLICCQK